MLQKIAQNGQKSLQLFDSKRDYSSHCDESKQRNEKPLWLSFLIAKTRFFTVEWVLFALSTHFGQHEDQSQIDIFDEETWVTHGHVDKVDQLVTMTFIFSLDALLKIL